MIENIPDPNGDPTAGEPDGNPELDKSGDDDDNSIRALVEAQLAEGDASPAKDPSTTPDPSDDGADAPTVDDAPAAPQSWTEAERETWADMPDLARDAISRREKEYQAGLKSDAELQKVVAPLGDQLAGSGVHVDQYIQGLIAGDQFISSQPLDAALKIIERHNLADQVTDRLSNPAASVQPAQAGESQRIAELEARLEYSDQLAAATREWDAFVGEHPDAAGLTEVIASKIGADPRLSYGEAYEQAKTLISSFNGTDATALEAAKVAAATKASGKGKTLDLPRGRSGSTPPTGSTGNLRDDIAEAMRGQGIRQH